MTKVIEAKAVREARAAARRMAKKTELTYQQALDRVARDAGAEHWAAFTARHPTTTLEASPDRPVEAITARPHPPRVGVGGYLRAMVSGEHGANEDRIRSAMVISEAEDFVIDLPVDEDGMIEIDEDRVRRNMWWNVAKNAVTAPAAIMLIGGVYAGINQFQTIPYQFGFADVARVAAWVMGASLALFLICLAIGDQPGMERRRATAWTAMLWMQVLGVAAFFLNGFGAFDDALQRLTGITPDTGFILGVGALIIGGEIRRSLHALMALGAALGPKGEGSSFADREALFSAHEELSEEEREERKRNAPPHVPMTPEMARELGARKSGKGFGLVGNVLIGAVAIGCLLSFAGVVVQFGFGIDARPIGYAALVFLGPLVLVVMLGLVALFIGDLLQMPGTWRKRMRQHQLMRAHERARGA
jgi:hypothetical protein